MHFKNKQKHVNINLCAAWHRIGKFSFLANGCQISKNFKNGLRIYIHIQKELTDFWILEKWMVLGKIMVFLHCPNLSATWHRIETLTFFSIWASDSKNLSKMGYFFIHIQKELTKFWIVEKWMVLGKNEWYFWIAITCMHPSIEFTFLAYGRRFQKHPKMGSVCINIRKELMKILLPWKI